MTKVERCLMPHLPKSEPFFLYYIQLIYDFQEIDVHLDEYIYIYVKSLKFISIFSYLLKI